MDLWTFGDADASVASTCFGLRHARLVVLQPTVVSRFGCCVFECWVLRALVFVFECFVFETTYPGDRLAIVFARRRFALVIFFRFFLVISTAKLFKV